MKGIQMPETLTRLQLEDTICNLKKDLKFYESIKPACPNCMHFHMSRCAANDDQQIPEDFILLGCADWEYDEVPF